MAGSGLAMTGSGLKMTGVGHSGPDSGSVCALCGLALQQTCDSVQSLSGPVQESISNKFLEISTLPNFGTGLRRCELSENKSQSIQIK